MHKDEIEIIKVVCDETNNTKESSARNELNIDLYVVKRPQVESIMINFNTTEIDNALHELYMYIKENQGIQKNALLKAMKPRPRECNRDFLIQTLMKENKIYIDGVGKDGACYFAK
jgi:hypothetical protein